MRRQFVRLTGLGSDSFEQYREAIQAVQSLFIQKLGLQGFDPLQDRMYEGEYAIDLHTRYLTERRLVESDKHIPFPKDIDPNNVLEELRGGNLICTTDNVVQYLKKISKSGEPAKYTSWAPSDFKEGDIVEVALSFVAYPLPNVNDEPRYKLVLALRALIMITAEFRERSKPPRKIIEDRPHSSSRSRSPALPSSSSLKRKFVSYADVEVAENEDTDMAA